MVNQSSTERGYNYRWQQESKTFLKLHPLCVFCEALGRVEPAVLVDHIKPHRGDMALFWDVTNWQGLCAHCHSSTKQAMEHAENRPLIGLDGWPVGTGGDV